MKRQSTSTAAVAVSGLEKRYRTKVALAEIDFSFSRGEVLALLGPNGAGKTTTVEICEGLLQPTSGVVQVLGLDPWRDSEKLRTKIGVMPQGGGSYPAIYAAELLGLVASCAAHPLDQDWLLETLGLSEVARLPFKRLSVGQQQRLSLACAIVSRPELVFLDEPTAGMDPHARRLVWDIIRALRADGVSVVLTTHLIDEAETLADQVVIIDQGRVIAQGSPGELTARKHERLTFRAIPDLDLDSLRSALPPDLAARELTPGNYVIDGAITPTTVSVVTQWCAQQNVLPDDLIVVRQTLEDVFLHLTSKNSAHD